MENQTQPGKLQPLTPEELFNQAESSEQNLQELSQELSKEELEAISGGFDLGSSLKKVRKKAFRFAGRENIKASN